MRVKGQAQKEVVQREPQFLLRLLRRRVRKALYQPAQLLLILRGKAELLQVPLHLLCQVAGGLDRKSTRLNSSHPK